MGCVYMSQQPNLFTLKPRLKFNQTQAEPTTKIYPHTKTHFTTLSLETNLSLAKDPAEVAKTSVLRRSYIFTTAIDSLSLSSRSASTRVGHGYLAKFRVSVLKVSFLHFCRHSSNKSVDPDGVCFCPASKLFRFLFLRGC